MSARKSYTQDYTIQVAQWGLYKDPSFWETLTESKMTPKQMSTTFSRTSERNQVLRLQESSASVKNFRIRSCREQRDKTHE